MGENFIRLPVDGNGTRLHTNPFIELAYDGGTVDFEVDDVVDGALSSTSATVVSVTGTTATGTLLLLPVDPAITLFTDDEVLNVGGTPHAVADGIGTTIHGQAMHISSVDDPRNVLKVDSRGSSFARFTDGPQLIDVMGKSQISDVVPLGLYNFASDAQTQLVQQETVTGGTITYDSDDHSVLLTNTTTSGSFTRLVSKKYHKVINSSGQEVLLTSVFGDTGKVGLVRRLGYFDDDNGVFLMLSASSLGVVLRSSASGAKIDTFVSQSDVNGDALSNGLIDVSTINMYYADINQNGRIRVGAVDPAGGGIDSEELIWRQESRGDCCLNSATTPKTKVPATNPVAIPMGAIT